MPLKKPNVGASERSGVRAASWQSSPLAALPSLMEFCSLTLLEDGSKRPVGTLQISTSQGRWQLKLKDPGSNVYCFVTGETLEDALLAAEEVCATGEGDWRADTWQGKKPGGK